MFYDKYVKLCQEKGISPSKAAQENGINKSNVSNWKNNGYTPRGDVLDQLADYFGVTVDTLLGKTSPQIQTPALTKKDERDIAKDLEQLKADLESSETLMFDGDPMSDEAKEAILSAMKLGLEAAKMRNKEKYTPKKFKKDKKD